MLDVGLVREPREDVERGARNDAALGGVRDVALHRVRLARARLPVREHRGLVPAEDVVDHGRERLVEHLLLRAERREDVVERERVAERPRARALDHRHLLLLRARGHDGERVPLELALAHRPEPNDDLDPGLLDHRGGRR